MTTQLANCKQDSIFIDNFQTTFYIGNGIFIGPGWQTHSLDRSLWATVMLAYWHSATPLILQWWNQEDGWPTVCRKIAFTRYWRSSLSIYIWDILKIISIYIWDILKIISLYIWDIWRSSVFIYEIYWRLSLYIYEISEDHFYIYEIYWKSSLYTYMRHICMRHTEDHLYIYEIYWRHLHMRARVAYNVRILTSCIIFKRKWILG